MLNVTNYALQYSNVDFVAVKAANLDLFITEAAPIAGTPALTDAQVAELKTDGTLVIGYVDTSVTDDSRPYWDPLWTSDGTDTGTPNAGAPDWLKSGASNTFGIIANFTDFAWRQIVINQCVDLVTRGYSGVFLDDVAQYFALGQIQNNTDTFATSMQTLIKEIDDAIKVVNPDAVIIVNATPYLVTDGVGGETSAEALAFLQSADAMLLESFFGVHTQSQEAALQWAAAHVQLSMQVLALEYGGTPYQNHLFQQQAIQLGIIGSVSETSAYNTLGAATADATAGDDVLAGTFRADVIMALAGNDTIKAGVGDDVVYGNEGNDRLYGSTGSDALYGGSGDDTYYISTADDTVHELADIGIDTVRTSLNAYHLTTNVERLTFTGTGNFLGFGNKGANSLYGGTGNDRFVDVAGGADFFGGGGGSDTVDYRGATRGVGLNLLTKINTGAATGDTFKSIENYFGSATSADKFTAGKSAVSFYGYGGNDRLEGGSGRDRLSGGAGDDAINGGLKADVLTGGSGKDKFYFSKGHFGNDTITDYRDGTDKIGLASFNIDIHDLTIVYSGNKTAAIYILGFSGDSITLKSDHAIHLTTSDFLF
jgi:uncharacterized protein (TIGR01370 family)